MRAVVTGATGFLGKWLVNELLENSIEVTVLIRNIEKVPSDWDKRVNIILCTLEDMGSIKSNTVSMEPIDMFFHFAWAGTSGEEREDVSLQLANIGYTCDAVKLAVKLGCKKFIFAGSIMQYEAMRYMSSDGCKPRLENIYSTAKLAADLLAKTVAVSLGLPYINILISNIYGAGEKSARFINTTLAKMMNNEAIPLTHCNQLYDFIYVEDAVKAMCMAGLKGKPYETYYIGNPEQKPLKEFVYIMKRTVGSLSRIELGKAPMSGTLLTYDEFDTDKINRDFGFTPKICFEQGLELTKRWILDHK